MNLNKGTGSTRAAAESNLSLYMDMITNLFACAKLLIGFAKVEIYYLISLNFRYFNLWNKMYDWSKMINSFSFCEQITYKAGKHCWALFHFWHCR